MTNQRISPVRLTAENLSRFMDLKPKRGQRKWIAPNARTIAQAHYEKGVYLRGLAVGERPVGLVSLMNICPGHPDLAPGVDSRIASLWRLMIAGPEQGKGYGSQAMTLVLKRAWVWGSDRVQAFVDPGNEIALNLYNSFGLTPTGVEEDGELELSLTLADEVKSQAG